MSLKMKISGLILLGRGWRAKECFCEGHNEHLSARLSAFISKYKRLKNHPFTVG
jgi:hypothetical protein